MPPLPCLRPYHAKINPIRMNKCDLANTVWILQAAPQFPADNRLPWMPQKSQGLRLSHVRQISILSLEISFSLIIFHLYSALAPSRDRSRKICFE